MVSIVTTALAASLGLLVYFALPVAAMELPVRVRQRIGRFYLGLAARCLKQFAFVRRVLSGYDVMPIHVDDEEKQLRVTLTNSMLGEDNDYPFVDPDNRVQRLMGKPVAVCYEEIPAALDAELSELGHWIARKRTADGFHDEHDDDDERPAVEPFVRVGDNLRVVDPLEAFNLVPSGVNPEDVKTARQLTRKRFEKYGSGMSIRATLRVLLGFGVGFGALVVFQYVNVKLLDGQGGGLQNPVTNESVMVWGQQLLGVVA